jgi:TonB family protein
MNARSRASGGLAALVFALAGVALPRCALRPLAVRPDTRAQELAVHCDAGENEACDAAGLRALSGEGAPRDPARAAALFERTCARGSAVGCGTLGELRARGLGVARDDAAARALSLRACTAGHARACAVMGQLQLDGLGGPADAGAARALFRRACEGGAPFGCARLAWVYEHGVDVPTDFARAASLYRDACAAREADACLRLALLTLDGLGVAPDEARAAELVAEACAAGSAEACARRDAPAPPALPPDDGGGLLAPAAIRRVVTRELHQVDRCYAAALVGRPGLAGRVLVRFVIAGDGAVSSSAVLSGVEGAPALDACVAAAVGRWRFPRPRGGGTVSVDYPFNLSPE